MYDIYLTDVKIYHLLPVLLGKKFYEKKRFKFEQILYAFIFVFRFPLSVNMQKADLKSQIQSAVTAVCVCIGWGSCM